ncbi:MAG: RluA family pseudouridine synthase [Treponema sp.]|nr:RluA family pseudouridine synthase [Treponema sp.]
MFPPFPQEEAFAVCKKIIDALEHGILQLEQVGKISAERSGQGIMIGVAVCQKADGTSVILNTVSGISKKIKGSEAAGFGIFVEPIVSAEKIESALEKNDFQIHQLTEKINLLKKKRKRPDGKFENQTEEEIQLVKQRSFLCDESLKKVFGLYSFHCADGKIRSLLEICRKTQNTLPPTGTGDCCAPKLLDFAFKNNFSVKSMAEVFYGKNNKFRVNGKLCEPCDERCALILPEMLGLEILYQDEDIVVVNKQSGLLSVPGRGPEKQDCIVNRLKKLFPQCIPQPSVHRLDMETSGILVLALNEDSHRNLCKQFEEKKVQKRYIALIDGKLPEKFSKNGTMELYFRVDIENRPHQIWDEIYGKNAVTEWNWIDEEIYSSPDGTNRLCTRILFIPHTGRTHQLRLAAADIHGFGVPIIGDTLYGHCEKGERLMLHAEFLSFIHPATGKLMEFSCPASF